jgi:alpha/beta hydrolase fold
MPGLARTVERAVRTLGYDRLDVLGVSFGGVLAQQLAHQAPDLVRQLVLAAAAGVPFLGGIPGSPRRYQSPTYYRQVAGRLYGGAARRDPDALLHGSTARFAEAPSLRGYLDQPYAISFWTGLPWLWRLRQPTLVLVGDDDPVVPPVNGWILARVISDARLAVLPGGHLFLLGGSGRSGGARGGLPPRDGRGRAPGGDGQPGAAARAPARSCADLRSRACADATSRRARPAGDAARAGSGASGPAAARVLRYAFRRRSGREPELSRHRGGSVRRRWGAARPREGAGGRRAPDGTERGGTERGQPCPG